MIMDAIYEERGSNWSHQVSAMGTTQWLQRDQTLPRLQRVWLARLVGPVYMYTKGGRFCS